MIFYANVLMRWRIEDRRVRLVLYPFHIEMKQSIMELAYWEAFEYTPPFRCISMTSVGIGTLVQILNPLTIKRLSTFCIHSMHDALSPSHLIHQFRFACQTSFNSNFVLFCLRRFCFVQNFSQFHQRVRMLFNTNGWEKWCKEIFEERATSI